MKIAPLYFFAAIVISSFLTGCASTSDPNTDSIGFSPARAERERLDPKREQLGNEVEGTEAERIRAISLRNSISSQESSHRSIAEEISRVRAQQDAAQQTLLELKRQVSEAQKNSAADETLIARRDKQQAEVDRLTRVLHKLLQTE